MRPSTNGACARIVTFVTLPFSRRDCTETLSSYIFWAYISGLPRCPSSQVIHQNSGPEGIENLPLMSFDAFDQGRQSGIDPTGVDPTGIDRNKNRAYERCHERERGQTIFIVAVALVVVLGMAALAVDVTFYYVASSQAQKAVDAAALAGAKAFVTSGFTSGQLGEPASGAAQAVVCNGGLGLADVQARAAANQNKIAGAPAADFTATCTFAPGNPQITVTLSRPDLPIFFGRIWGGGSVRVSAAAKAEAYNPSGEDVPIEVASVKPWLLTNCDYTNQNPALLNPNCPLQLNAGGINVGADYFIDPHNNYQIANNGSFIGKPFRLQQVTVLGATLPTGILNSYYPLIIPITGESASCPSTGAVSCSQVDPGAPGYYERVACANSVRLHCGPAQVQGVSLETGGGPLGTLLPTPPNSDQATMCLTHAEGAGANQGQDIFDSLGPGSPETIEGGFNNPNAALRGALNVNRSDSVVTVPLWDGNPNPLYCSFAPCPDTIVGFMQLGIRRVVGPTDIEAVILNVSGCGAATGGATPVAGHGVAPIPVRLVQ